MATGAMGLILVVAFIPAKGEYTCYSSSSSEAKDIQLVYDDNLQENLWFRNNSALVPCNFSSISSSKCYVCLDSAGPDAVLVVLCNVMSSVKPMFESSKRDLSFNQIGCPHPEPITTSSPATTRANDERGRIGVYIPLVTLPLIIVVIVYLAREHLKRQQAPAKGPNVVFRPVNDSAEIKMPENGHAAD